MFENAIYSVISPEGCASILWRDPSKSLEAAKAMKLTATDLLKIGIIDEVIGEPLGGAHRNKDQVLISTKVALKKYLEEFSNYNKEEIFEQRKNKFLEIGKQSRFTQFLTGEGSIVKEKFFTNKKKLAIISIILLAVVVFLFL